jgi:hypothetical protein
MTGTFTRGNLVSLTGRITRDGVGVPGVEVHILGTDQLLEETTITDVNGWFSSENLYEAGQMIRIEAEGHVFSMFVSYVLESGETWSLGTFDIGG